MDTLFDSDILAARLGQRDIIYSTGLFDYFNDQSFRKLLSIIYGVLPKGGRMYIGNMSTENPTRWLIEYACDWFIFHPTQDEMIRLADQLVPRPVRGTVEGGASRHQSVPAGDQISLHTHHAVWEEGFVLSTCSRFVYLNMNEIIEPLLPMSDQNDLKS